jgi:hypothetical protein
MGESCEAGISVREQELEDVFGGHAGRPGKRTPELQNQSAGASLSVMLSRIQLADRRLRIVAVTQATYAEAP